MQSKENLVLKPFFNTPKHWHFEELRKHTGISKPQLSFWLKRFVKQGIVKKTKVKGKMPYYTALSDNPEFQNRKRLFALQEMTSSGLLNHLSTLKHAKVVIIFGSFTSYDWYDNSDIDIFLYGSEDFRELLPYKYKLNRDIQLHVAKSKKDLRRINKMIPHILSGYLIKGSIDKLGLEIHA